MTLIDVVNLGKVLEFKNNRTKTNVDEPNERYSAYKIENDICIRIANHRTKLRSWLNNFKDKQFPKKCISIVFLHENEINQYADCKLPENVNFTVDEYVYNMDNINSREVFNQLKGDITDAFKTGNYANNTLNTNNKSIKALKYKLQKENNMENNMKNNDRKILESLITKYGKSNINLAINRLNENTENPKSGIFIEYHDHLSCDAFRILVLDNGVNVLKNDPLEVEVVGSYTGKQYIAKLESKYNNDYIEVNFVHSYDGDLCLVKAIKELHAKYSNLPIYCFTKGFYTFKGEYKNVQELFNDIFSKYLRGLSFEFIPGTMGEFLKSNMNESLKTNIVNEAVYEYDYNRLSDCPLTYNTQLDFKKYFIKRSTQEGYEFNKNIFYFDDIDCVDTKTSRDIPGVKANKTLNFDEAYNRLLKYFLNNLQEQVNESDDLSMYDAFGEVIYPGDYVIVVAHNDKYPEGKMLKGTFVKLAANSRLVGVIETEEYDQKTYKFPKYIKKPQICIAKYK